MSIGRFVGGAALAGVAVFAGVSSIGDDTTRNDTGEIIESGGLGVFAFQHGDCIQFAEDETEAVDEIELVEEVASVKGVPCAEPHDAQVYAEYDLPGGEYPGDEAIFEAGSQGCYERFDAATGIEYDVAPDDDFTIFYPSGEGWEQGDHAVTCFLVRTDASRWTGSGLASDRA